MKQSCQVASCCMKAGLKCTDLCIIKCDNMVDEENSPGEAKCDKDCLEEIGASDV